MYGGEIDQVWSMPEGKSCLRRCLLVLLSGLSVLAILVMVGFYVAADWLHVENKPEHADAALVLSGGYYRALYAADLYQHGYVKHIYISKAVVGDDQLLLDRLGIPNMRQEDIYLKILEHQGVPVTGISTFGRSAISTYEEALNAHSELAPSVRTLLIVTSPFHVRRAELIFSNVLKQKHVIVLATPYESFPKKWWTNQSVARNVVLELIKIPFYLLGGGFVASPEIASGK